MREKEKKRMNKILMWAAKRYITGSNIIDLFKYFGDFLVKKDFLDKYVWLEVRGNLDK